MIDQLIDYRPVILYCATAIRLQYNVTAKFCFSCAHCLTAAAAAAERVSGSLTFVTEEKPTKEFVSDMLPVDKRRPLYSGPDADAGDDDDDDDDVPDSQNGNTEF